MFRFMGQAREAAEFENSGGVVRRGPEDDQKIMDLAPGTKYMDSDGEYHVRPKGGKIENGRWTGYTGTINAKEYEESRDLQAPKEKVDVSGAEFKPGYVTYLDPESGEFKLTNDWGEVPDKRNIVNEKGEFLTSFVDMNRVEDSRMIYYDPNHVTSEEFSNVIPVFGKVFKPESEEAQRTILGAVDKQAREAMERGWTHAGQYRYFQPGEEVPEQYQPANKDQVAGEGGLYFDSAAPDTGLSTWAGKDTEKYLGSALEVVGTAIAAYASWTGIGGLIGLGVAGVGGAINAYQADKEWWEGAALGAAQAYLLQFGVAGAAGSVAAEKTVNYERDLRDIIQSEAINMVARDVGQLAGDTLGKFASTVPGKVAASAVGSGAVSYASARLQGADESDAWFSAGASGASSAFGRSQQLQQAERLQNMSDQLLAAGQPGLASFFWGPTKQLTGETVPLKGSYLQRAGLVANQLYKDVLRAPQSVIADAYTTLDSLAGGSLPDIKSSKWWDAAGVDFAGSDWGKALRKAQDSNLAAWYKKYLKANPKHNFSDFPLNRSGSPNIEVLA